MWKSCPIFNPYPNYIKSNSFPTQFGIRLERLLKRNPDKGKESLLSSIRLILRATPPPSPFPDFSGGFGSLSFPFPPDKSSDPGSPADYAVMPAASRGQPSYTDYLGGRTKDNIAICSFSLFVGTGGFGCLCSGG
ncbi:hypothetical protein CDAR_173231 [Caerostris darwini]|uniref:Uncharacterized protein n=1 Tax=Caerostris darwini TaxID=1538125 RepID=A0AAV4WJI7_9ARAC|nr:hypothetical protein CDAR_173231 [Caerostris darwini]